ncbi:MAG: hypothetical protein EAX90_13065 [Candidatus Heimdallarchaeota archaeon]|nr:hypothetical protein [Candidatus Heimdallarchaeota archaeon]
MALEPLTLYYIIESWISEGIFLILIGFLIANFVKKKTTGTLMLLITYSIFAVTKFITGLSYTLQPFTGNTFFTDSLQLFSTSFTIVGLIFLYIFASRHILRDSEVMKALHIILISMWVGILGTLTFVDRIVGGISFANFDVLGEYQPLSGQINNLPVNIILSMVFILINVYVFLRVSIRSIILARRTDKLLRKRGLQMIGWGLFVYFLGGTLGGLVFSAVGAGQWLLILLWQLRSLLLTTSYIMMYIGWIMPDWFTRYVRGKTWFEKKYKDFSKHVIERAA